jgi:hypothetical protein
MAPVVAPDCADPAQVPEQIVASFVRELRRQRGAQAVLSTVAIVDERPAEQFLFPEFRLYQQLFERHGARALIVDPSELVHRDGRLWVADVAVDLVYNRLTDFYFESPGAQALAAAYAAGDVVVTPGPRAHALFADKQHLTQLCDEATLRGWGADDDTVATLIAHVPKAEMVTPIAAERLWQERKQWFFKPRYGYGSKAAYRGDKLTTKTWESIVRGDYIAQRLVPPSQRTVEVAGETTALKLDVRAYVDDEQVLLLSSRLYQGQTTNFRTRGGGFAAVFSASSRCTAPGELCDIR